MIVTPQTFRFDTPLPLKSGAVLPAYELSVETYGTLSADRAEDLIRETGITLTAPDAPSA